MTRIGEARKATLGEIETVAADAAKAMVERVAGFTVDDGAARAAVAKELADG